MKERPSNPNGSKEAVIYARVSSPSQTARGDGLGSQETRCREYARGRGYIITDVFTDDMSGSLITRPGMQTMLKHLNGRREAEPVVIIDDISRLARDIITHWELRSVISKAGGRLESPSVDFGEDSDSVLMENLLASVSQHQRQKNAEQTVNRMRARILNGYWCFQAPIGYRYERQAGQGNVLVRDEPHASILQEALEGFAAGRMQSQAEVKRFLEQHPQYPNDLPNGEIRAQRITDLLTRSLYAGMIEVPRWNIGLRKGHHEGLISLETFNRIQAKLDQPTRAASRKDLNADFPLRGAICCSDCRKPLTASWSSGKRRKYGYYSCYNRECPSYRKSIPRDRVETEFEVLLEHVKPSGELRRLVHKMFSDVWEQRRTQRSRMMQSMKSEIADLSKQIDAVVDRIVDTSSAAVVNAYEKRISALEAKKTALEEQYETGEKPTGSFEEKFEHAMSFLSNPLQLWRSGRFEDKRTVLKLTFAGHLAYCRKQGFRTPDLSLPFKVLTPHSGDDFRMAHLDLESSNTLFNTLASWEHQLSYRETVAEADDDCTDASPQDA